MATRPRPLERLGLGRQVLVEERDELGAERLDVGVERQLHGAPGRTQNWKDFYYHQNENTILIAEKVTISDTLAARGSRTAMARRSPVQSVHVLPNRQASEPPVTSPSEEPAWKQRAVERSIKTAKLRAAQRVQRFLDAAQAIIIEKGSTDFTVQEVVDRSRQSLRSFYLQFDGKHELLLALFEDALSRSADQIRAATASHDGPDRTAQGRRSSCCSSPRGPTRRRSGRCSPTSRRACWCRIRPRSRSRTHRCSPCSPS